MRGQIALAVARAAAETAVQGVLSRIGKKPAEIVAEVTPMATKAAGAIMDDPKVVNATNQEPLRQSGVMWGGGITTAAAIAVVAQAVDAYPQVGLAGLDWSVLAPALIALFGGVFTIVRRVGSWKPLTLFGLLGKR